MIFGFIAGPITNFLQPDLIFKDMLSPIISLSVAIILFEGGMSLRLHDLRSIGKVIRNLVTIGALINFIIITIAALFLLKLDPTQAILLGSILIVTGPTVVAPLLHYLHVSKRIKLVLHWEGIIIDPIGAILALVVFQTFFLTNTHEHLALIIITIFKTTGIGFILGVIGASITYTLMQKELIPEHLQESMILMFVICLFVGSNLVQHEAGLFSVTIMGIILANQRNVHIKHIIIFKENLSILLISALFIILSARIPLPQLLEEIQWQCILFLFIVIFIARPISVYFSTINSIFTFKERLFIGLVAPRGIVAAVIASFFALQLSERGITDNQRLVTYTFMVILATISFNSLTSNIISKWLKLSQENKLGIVIIGAHKFARKIGLSLKETGIPILIIDSSKKDCVAARSSGLKTIQTNILSKKSIDEIEKAQKYRLLLAISPNDETNYLATMEYAKIFGRSNVFRLHPSDRTAFHSVSLLGQIGRILFGKSITYTYISARIIAGACIAQIPITEEYKFEHFCNEYGDSAIPLFLISSKKIFKVVTAEKKLKVKAGETLIALTSKADKYKKWSKT